MTATVDEVRSHVHEVAAIYECYALVRDELMKAAREHGHEEYKDGLYRAMQILLTLHERRQSNITDEIQAWEYEVRRELRLYGPGDPRAVPAVVVH